MEGLDQFGRGTLASGSVPTKVPKSRRLTARQPFIDGPLRPASVGLFFGLLAPPNLAFHNLPHEVRTVLKSTRGAGKTSLSNWDRVTDLGVPQLLKVQEP